MDLVDGTTQSRGWPWKSKPRRSVRGQDCCCALWCSTVLTKTLATASHIEPVFGKNQKSTTKSTKTAKKQGKKGNARKQSRGETRSTIHNDNNNHNHNHKDLLCRVIERESKRLHLGSRQKKNTHPGTASVQQRQTGPPRNKTHRYPVTTNTTHNNTHTTRGTERYRRNIKRSRSIKPKRKRQKNCVSPFGRNSHTTYTHSYT